MFGFNKAVESKRDRQEASKLNRERFAVHGLKDDSFAGDKTGRANNIFVRAQSLINRGRSRGFQNPISIL
jgi:hypothetical protein